MAIQPETEVSLDRGLLPISQGGEPVIGGRGPVPCRGVPVSGCVRAILPGSPAQLPGPLQFDEDGIEKPVDQSAVLWADPSLDLTAKLNARMK